MIEYIQTSLAAQAGGPVKVIEGTIEPTSPPGARASQAQAEPADDGGRYCDWAAGAQAEEARAVAC